MTPIMVTAICGGLAALIGSITTMIVQLNKIHTLVNSRMTQALNKIEQLERRMTPQEAANAIAEAKTMENGK